MTFSCTCRRVACQAQLKLYLFIYLFMYTVAPSSLKVRPSIVHFRIFFLIHHNVFIEVKFLRVIVPEVVAPVLLTLPVFNHPTLVQFPIWLFLSLRGCFFFFCPLPRWRQDRSYSSEPRGSRQKRCGNHRADSSYCVRASQTLFNLLIVYFVGVFERWTGPRGVCARLKTSKTKMVQ